MKKTLILGASPNPQRYAYIAADRLQNHGHEFVPLGIKKGEVFGKEILNGNPELEDIDTVTLYLSPKYQTEWYDYILNLKPKRIIFNPGTENPELREKAQKKGIDTIDACTLVMLSTGQF